VHDGISDNTEGVFMEEKDQDQLEGQPADEESDVEAHQLGGEIGRGVEGDSAEERGRFPDGGP